MKFTKSIKQNLLINRISHKRNRDNIKIYENTIRYLGGTLDSDTLGKQVFELKGVTLKDIQNGATGSFSIRIRTLEINLSAAIFRVDTGMAGKMLENINDGVTTRGVQFDTSKLFTGWK